MSALILEYPITTVKQERQDDGTYQAVQVEITEIEVPDFLSVGDIRGIHYDLETQMFKYAEELLVKKSKISKVAIVNLQAIDATAYMTKVMEIYEAYDDGSDEYSEAAALVPEKFSMYAMGKINVNVSKSPVEWGAQVLQHCGGIAKTEIDAMPIAKMMTLLPLLVEGCFNPKKA